ncbi:vWA domain-containing protein [Legionella dresdenensis]|uniref:VWA domain-containing protein n=1 Tax=Legionella dresdenensis TaxID=450200 RepID=A0ABV8CIF2_9GAMM
MFEFANPWILSLIILPALIWFLIPRAEIKLPAALKIPFFTPLQAAIAQRKPALVKHGHIGVLLLSWLLMIGAAAGPRWVGEPLALTREGRNIMLVLDLSGSMELNDMQLHGRPVSRLAVVKRAAEQFVEERAGDRIGLILFGSQAYLQTPLTYDRRNVLLRLEDASVGLAGKTTSIGDALGLAVKRLQDVPSKSRVIILLTDGANNSGVLAPLKAAELAKDDKIKVYTIGLGAEADPQAYGDPFFNLNAGADLDEKTLKKIADMTGGQYFRATDSQSLQQIYGTINQLEAVKQDKASIRPQKEYYPWLLAAAMILMQCWLAAKAGLLTFRPKKFTGSERLTNAG